MRGRVEPKKHDSGSQANETLDGLDYTRSRRGRVLKTNRLVNKT